MIVDPAFVRRTKTSSAYKKHDQLDNKRCAAGIHATIK